MELNLFDRKGALTAKATQHVVCYQMIDGCDEQPPGPRATQTEARARLMTFQGEQGSLMNLWRRAQFQGGVYFVRCPVD